MLGIGGALVWLRWAPLLPTWHASSAQGGDPFRSPRPYPSFLDVGEKAFIR
jgi:hypothetical protein